MGVEPRVEHAPLPEVVGTPQAHMTTGEQAPNADAALADHVPGTNERRYRADELRVVRGHDDRAGQRAERFRQGREPRVEMVQMDDVGVELAHGELERGGETRSLDEVEPHPREASGLDGHDRCVVPSGGAARVGDLDHLVPMAPLFELGHDRGDVLLGATGLAVPAVDTENPHGARPSTLSILARR